MKKLQLTIMLLFVTFVALQAQEQYSESVKTARKDLVENLVKNNKDFATTALFEKDTLIIKFSFKNETWDELSGQVLAEMYLKVFLDKLTDDVKAIVRITTKIEYIEVRLYNPDKTLISRSLKAFK